jgi:hypothetical protein
MENVKVVNIRTFEGDTIANYNIEGSSYGKMLYLKGNKWYFMSGTFCCLNS